MPHLSDATTSRLTTIRCIGQINLQLRKCILKCENSILSVTKKDQKNEQNIAEWNFALSDMAELL